jgi:hypothetical protein
MEELVELLSQIQELAAAGIEALEGAAGGAPAEGPPPEGEAPPEEPPA